MASNADGFGEDRPPYGDFPQTICPDPSDESHFALSQIRETVWWQYERSENHHFETDMREIQRTVKFVGDWEKKKWAIEKKKVGDWEKKNGLMKKDRSGDKNHLSRDSCWEKNNFVEEMVSPRFAIIGDFSHRGIPVIEGFL